MYAIEMNNITKKFPGVLANDDITLKVKKQEIHSLLGENGSGKSTLMNILFGLHESDGGEIYKDGKKVFIKNPEDAHSLGLGMVHQHFMLVEQMSALENIILGSEPGNFFLDRKKSYEKVINIVEEYGFHLDLNEKVANLSIGMKQRVEIIKALYRGAEILILDEPTAVLTPQEVGELFDIINMLKEDGKTIIFITHKLDEIMEVADTITVIRSGKQIDSIAKKDTNVKDLARKMVGRHVDEIVTKNENFLGDTVLELENIQLLEIAREKINLNIKSGEILGIAGVEGNGQLQLEELIVGLFESEEGKILFDNIDISKYSPYERKNLGIGYIPSDRYKRAILPAMSVRENFLLGFHEKQPFIKNGFIQNSNLNNYSDKMIQDFDIRVPNFSYPMGNLSGGNQQKVVLARETTHQPKLIIAAQPTRGLDVGAIEYVHKNLLALKEKGIAILLISAELSEVMNLSDRISVMYEGEIQGTLANDEFDKEKIGLLMAGNEEEASI